MSIHCIDVFKPDYLRTMTPLDPVTAATIISEPYPEQSAPFNRDVIYRILPLVKLKF